MTGQPKFLGRIPVGKAESLTDPTDDTVKRYETVDSMIWKSRQLAAKIGSAVLREEIPRVDIVLSLARGGWTIGEVVARSLSIEAFDCQSASVDSYTGVGTRRKLRFGQRAERRRLQNAHVLIIDDVVDSSETMVAVTGMVGSIQKRAAKRHKVLRRLGLGRPDFTEGRITTATIYSKNPEYVPDFYVEKVDKDEWIVFQFDECSEIGDWFQSQFNTPPDQRDQTALAAYNLAAETPYMV